ncbi:MAG: hypothetical protein GQ553_01990 [Nitrosomonadaceae bacterium]|nr:hypothetical protein [Nitrosomonadaceae bacterium]
MKHLPGGPDKTITKATYLQLLGLFVLHKKAEAHRFAIEKAIAELVDEKPDEGGTYHGHVSDSLFENASVEDMLFKLEIKMEDDNA